jgi:hypothetical protein
MTMQQQHPPMEHRWDSGAAVVQAATTAGPKLWVATGYLMVNVVVV